MCIGIGIIDDSLIEGEEAFTVSLGPVTGEMISNRQATVFIFDNG